jgi:hypothetical protein
MQAAPIALQETPRAATLFRAPHRCYASLVPALFKYFSFDYFEEWKPVSKAAGISWLVVYALFFLYAAVNAPNFLFIDFANLLIHEAGHPLFSPFGYTITILGGTLLELIAPIACFILFFFKRETTAVAFCSFWFFENFLYIGTYMADARAQELPLVGSGDHDWAILFSYWGVLRHDLEIGHTTRALGWLGMLATMVWLAWRTYQNAREPETA